MPDPTTGHETRGWQPIATAPKDGTEILALTETGQRVVVQWGYRAAWPDNKFWIGAEYSTLTCWMPLPDPPACPGPVPA